VATVDESDKFEAAVCTKEAIGAIQGGRATGQPRRQIDFRSQVLPLLLAEMQIRYYAQSALLVNGRAASDEVTRQLGQAWRDGSYETVVMGLAGRYGEFDPWVHFFGPRRDYVSSKDYESQIYSLVEADLCESLRGGSAPVKSAYEVFRHLKDLMRTVIEFSGLTLESYLDFRDNIKTTTTKSRSRHPSTRSPLGGAGHEGVSRSEAFRAFANFRSDPVGLRDLSGGRLGPGARGRDVGNDRCPGRHRRRDDVRRCADRSVRASAQPLDRAHHVEHRPGVERRSPTWVLGVAVGSAGLSYGAVASRGLLAGGGPAALAAGTGATMLVAFLAAFLLRTRARNGS
jgi:hypothetical protein